MKHPVLSMLVFMAIALLAGGIIGYQSTESLSLIDAFHTTISTLTFSENSASFSAQGKLLHSALSIATVAVIIWAFINFHSQNNINTEKTEEYFKLIPQDERLMLREI